MYIHAPIPQKKSSWRDFENLVADIFERFDYTVMRDVRFKTARRFQIDLVAYNERLCIFIDCKDHAYINPSKEEAFIEKQRVRADNLGLEDKRFQYKKKKVLLVTKHKTDSMILGSADEGRILSVDADSLPYLLRDINIYEDNLVSID
ncbi:restriction endonuclease [Candidatus Parvarchaeota archaeon]|nr:restriction endonuclease [Candidatus Parvarchaeota archaeon]